MITTEFGQNLTPSIPEVQTREHAWDSFAVVALPAAAILLHNVLYLNGLLSPVNTFPTAVIVRFSAALTLGVLGGKSESRRQKKLSPDSIRRILGTALIAAATGSRLASMAGFDVTTTQSAPWEEGFYGLICVAGVCCHRQ